VSFSDGGPATGRARFQNSARTHKWDCSSSIFFLFDNGRFMPLIQRIPNSFSTSFSNAVVVTIGEHSTIYISGQVGYVVGGPVKVTAESFEEEAMLCYFNIDRSLQEVGATLKDIVRITAYLTDAKDYPVYDKVRQETFAGAPPSSSTVIVAGLLANAKLEVDAIAVIKN